MPKLERFLATVAYDGTDHIGWQVQNGRLSIEGELEERLSVDELGEWAALFSIEAEEQKKAMREAEQRAKASSRRRR